MGCDSEAAGSVWGFRPLQPKGVCSPLYGNTGITDFRYLGSSQAEIPSISVLVLAFAS